jgi:osmotically-inducible protein OsmY
MSSFTIRLSIKYALIAVLGAAGMYWLDPEQGRRRRALVRDKLLSGLTQMMHATDVLGRIARNRLHGTAARTRSLIRANDVSDEVLVARVRAALGRATSHPGAIEVSCWEGVVTLQGAVLKHEHARVMRAARSAAGGSEVHDEIAVYKRPDGIPALQGRMFVA